MNEEERIQAAKDRGITSVQALATINMDPDYIPCDEKGYPIIDPDDEEEGFWIEYIDEDGNTVMKEIK